MRRWDIFCRVVDNFGDIGVCWRLARQLAAEFGIAVRLWVDDLESFARLCPAVAPDVAVQRVEDVEIWCWPESLPLVEVADVVIEAFACELPENYITAMAEREVAPVWINLEYLSAESWVEDCHLLPSPQGKLPLIKHFFFPGFTSRTGGLLRERDLLIERAKFDPLETGFWSKLGVPPASAGEIRVSLFCYENPTLTELLQIWAGGSELIRVFAAPGAATNQIAGWLGRPMVAGQPIELGSLIIHPVPFLSQADYDRLLWACDVNFVRGEDSFVRAQWAQRPFVWQIYPQEGGAHLGKLDAFLSRYLAEVAGSDAVLRCFRAWNGAGELGTAWTDFLAKRVAIEHHGQVWAGYLDHAGNLANNLCHFVCGKLSNQS